MRQNHAGTIPRRLIPSYPFNLRNPWSLHVFFYTRDRFEIAESIPDHGSHGCVGLDGGKRCTPIRHVQLGSGAIVARNGRTATIANKNQFIRSYPFNPSHRWLLYTLSSPLWYVIKER